MADFILESNGSVRRVSVETEEIRIGRADDNEIVLEDDRASRLHAVIKRREGRWVVQDLKSGNGTYVDGVRAARVGIERGAVITIGNVDITFLGGSDAAAPAAAPAGAPTDDAPQIPGRKAVSLIADNVLTRDYEYIDDVTSARETVRVVHPHWLEGDTGWLDQAIDAWAELDHPNIARLVRVPHDEASCLRERLAEESLEDRIRESKGRMPQGDAIEVGIAVARALVHLHDQGLIHGGVHPALVRLDPEAPARLAGPGVPTDRLDRVQRDHMDQLAGLAPETFSPSGTTGRRSDVYALGALLHHCVIGSSVSEGKTLEALDTSASKGLFKPPSERRPTLVAGLSDLIERCVAVEPSERPESVREVLSVLEALLTSAKARPKGGEVRVEARERELGERAPSEPPRSLRSRSISWGITICLLLAINVPIFLYFGGDRGNIRRPSTSSNAVQPPARTNREVVESTMNEFIEADRFDRAAGHVADAVSTGLIKPGEASVLQARLATRKSMRVMSLTDAVEDALEAGDGMRAKSSLELLGRVAGEGDADYQRLATRVKEH